MSRVGSTLRITVHGERNQTGSAPWRTLKKWLQVRAMRKLQVRAEEGPGYSLEVPVSMAGWPCGSAAARPSCHAGLAPPAAEPVTSESTVSADPSWESTVRAVPSESFLGLKGA